MEERRRCRATFILAFDWMVCCGLSYPVPAVGCDLLLNRIINHRRVDLTMNYAIGRTGMIERRWRLDQLRKIGNDVYWLTM